jgi:hypothetical protein
MTLNRPPNAARLTNAVHSHALVASATLLLSLLGAGPARADPSAFSKSQINDIRTSSPPESIGTTSSSVSDGPNSAGSFLLPTSGTLGAVVNSDGSVVGVSTSTGHSDDWTCGSGASCAVAGPMNVTIDFDASFSASGIGEFSLEAQYLLGSSVFSIAVGQDSSPVTADASWGGAPVAVVLTPDPLTNTVHVSTHFVGQSEPTSCNGSAGPCGIFSDQQFISIEMEGHGFVDASHTFSVSLAPTNPTVFLTSADGRSAGSVVGQVPEPATFALLGAGLAMLATCRRGARSFAKRHAKRHNNQSVLLHCAANQAQPSR